MANEEQLARLKRSVEEWNAWRVENPKIGIDLSGADLSEAILDGANFRGGANLLGANLVGARLRAAFLTRANLMAADLSGADLRKADLSMANLTLATLIKADLRDEANLSWVDLNEADLTEAKLNGANLRGASLVETNLTGATLTGSHIYGISAWNLELKGAKQSNLIITKDDEPTVMVDDLEVAQFVYLLLRNKKIRNVLDTIGKKGVLILGRFTPERKAILDALWEKFRQLGFLPMMFDFEGAESRDFRETVKTLAGLSRFIVADITNPKSSPLELEATVPNYMVPFVPIIQSGEEPFSMFTNLKNTYDWVMHVLEYDDSDQLISVTEKAIVKPASILADELNIRKAQETRKRHAKDYQ